VNQFRYEAFDRGFLLRDTARGGKARNLKAKGTDFDCVQDLKISGWTVEA
jgi:hypothetical protein